MILIFGRNMLRRDLTFKGGRVFVPCLRCRVAICLRD